MMTMTNNISAPLQELLAMPLSARIEAVIKDVMSHEDKFKNIDSHALADALGVPETESPGQGWCFTRYAMRESVETYAEGHFPVSEIVYLIEDKVAPERFQTLLKYSLTLDGVENPRFDFLTEQEREQLIEAITADQLESNSSNGMNCIAHYVIESPLGEDLWFEAEIEDDGACIILRTPYDSRDNRFIDLTNCLVDEWCA
jgi:hypothetical protein